MQVRRFAAYTILWAVMSLCLADAASAQSSLQVPIQFDFLNPGARSLAMGGAFVGLADDATAALVNPGGLVRLTASEVSVEGRYRNLRQPFLVGGRLSGTPTDIGQDTVSGPEFQTISDSNFGPTFLSFVYVRKRVRLAAFRHELIDLGQEFTSRGVFQNHGFDTRDTAFTGKRTLSVTGYGLSVAYDAKRVWLGGGLLIERFKLGFVFDRYADQSFYGVPDPSQLVFHFTQNGDDAGVGAVVGAVVPISTRRMKISAAKIGVAYRRSPKFDFSSFSGGLAGSQQHFNDTFKVPDTLAFGGSISFHSIFIVSAEYTLVWQSQLFNDYVRLLASQGESSDRVDHFSIADGNEIHVGAEYAFRTAATPRIRGGAWYDPDHSVHYTPTPANDLLDERIAAALSSGRSLWHGTLGAMVSIGPRTDLSVAVDHSSRSTVVSTSAIISF